MKSIKVKQMSFKYILLFISFSLSFVVGSSLMLPYGEKLRWLGPITLFIVGVLSNIRNDNLFSLWPKQFNFLFPTFIISVFTLNYGLSYGIAKLSSFLLLISGTYIFMDRESFTRTDLMNSFTIMSYLLNIIILNEFIFLVYSGVKLGAFSGHYSNKNLLVSLAMSSTVCSIWLLIKNNKVKIVNFIFVVSNTIVIIATGSRAGVVGLFIILLGSLFIFFDFKYLLKKIKLIITLFILLAVIVILIKTIEIPALSRILADKSNDYSTGISRGTVWSDGIQIFKEKPYLGWGYGSTNYHIFINNPSSYFAWGVHNSFLTILIENGLIGSILYSFFFISYFIEIIKSFTSVNYGIIEKKFMKTLILLCLVLLINAISESFLFSVGNPMAIPFWNSLLIMNLYIKKYKKVGEIL